MSVQTKTRISSCASSLKNREMDQKDTEMNEKGVSSSTSGVVVQVREKKGALRAAIPYMPFQ